MNRDTKKGLKKVGPVYAMIIQTQFEEYCNRGPCVIIIINKEEKIVKL